MSVGRKRTPTTTDPDQTRPIEDLVREVLGNTKWLDEKNFHLDLKTPREAIKEGYEKSVRDIILAAKNGMFS